MSTAIKVENLSKAYQLGTIGTGTISRDLERWIAKVRGKEDPFLTIGEANDRAIKGTSDVVLSLNNVSFDIQQGDAVGIIGRNGAGKSTLLKLLSRVTSPTSGSIKIKGRIASLLEVGTGFHPELTGRENIFLNGAILGMRKKEIKRKFDQIVDFAGVERYIDTPVKRYSSGMYVRLAFAVAAHLESEILIVDEVLAVGDAEFQKKCLGKMGDVSKGEGRTVLFVSHNMGSIKALCNKGILLSKGTIEYNGTAEESTHRYLIKDSTSTGTINLDPLVTSEIKINSILINSSNSSRIHLKSGENVLKLEIFGILKIQKSFSTEVRIYDELDNPVAFYSPGHFVGESPKYDKGDFYLCENITLPENFNKGNFKLSLALTIPGVEMVLSFPEQLELTIDGYLTNTGWSFESKNVGYIMLH